MAPRKTAYVTGGASGIGRAVTEMLAARGIKVAIADMNLAGAESVAASLNTAHKQTDLVTAHQLNAADWDSQLSVFEKVVKLFDGQIDLVYPIAGIGEQNFLPHDPKKRFVKPNLGCLDVDLNGFLYTASLAIQQMRRQEKGEDGLRGKIATVASVCGFYCVPSKSSMHLIEQTQTDGDVPALPIYTAAKHAVVGFVRSFGKYLPEEDITLNAVCPNVVRTNISVSAFYDGLETQGLLTPMKGVIDAFEQFLDGDGSGECLEAGPNGNVVRRAPAEHLDDETNRIMEMLYHRGRPLHQPVAESS
ncbi:hypothetical protein LTR53_004162 [Teratosphaeriaceae sp. CCFEE 6253]|nr:hypothetical protein LTR53_004162 [Teratosphaeriaceae sp. CCFEE 6253]